MTGDRKKWFPANHRTSAPATTTGRNNPMTNDEARAKTFPNVRPSRAQAGRWEARRPSNGRQHYIGTFDTPEAARYAVCIAQADTLEARAKAYRAEADMLKPWADNR